MTTYSILNTVAASAADMTFAVGKITIGYDSLLNKGPGAIKYLDILSVKKTQPVAAVLGVSKVTITVAASTEYSFLFSQRLISGNQLSQTITYTSTTTISGTTVMDALKAKFDNLGFDATFVVTSATVGTITNASGAEVNYIGNISNTAAVNDGTSSSVVGVYPVNTYAALNGQGIAEVLASKTYDSFEILFAYESNPTLGAASKRLIRQHTFYLNKTDAADTRLVHAITDIFEGISTATYPRTTTIADYVALLPSSTPQS